VKFWIENIIEYPNVQYTDADLSATHTDESENIAAWDRYGLEVLQYMHVRRSIIPLVIAKAGADYSNWDSLTPEEQAIGINWIAAPYSLRVPTITDQTDRENWNKLVKCSRGVSEECTEGRSYIIELMRERVADNLRTEAWTNAIAENFYFDTAENIEAYEFANASNLIDWINNEGQYENAGFKQTSYYSLELENDLTQIYNGFY
jgi:hypothetical protein